MKVERENSMDDNIQNQITQYILTGILKQPNRKLDPNEALISSGLIDSFSLVDLALFIEDTYSVRIADTELNSQTFDNIQELASMICKRLQ